MKADLIMLWSMIMKNLKVIFRTKTSALIILLGPLLIIAIVGIAFNSTGLNNVRIGYYSEAKLNPSTDEILYRFKNMKIMVFEMASEEACFNQVKEGRFHACLIFPVGYDFDDPTSQKKIGLAIDFSRINIAWIITDNIMGQIRAEGSMLSRKIITEMIAQIQDTNSNLLESKNALVQISSDGEQISLKISDMKNQLNTLDINVSLADINASDMAQFSGADISSDIDNFKASLGSLQEEIESAKDSYESQRQASIASLNENKESMNKSKAELIDQKTLLEGYYALCTDPNTDECKLLKSQIDILDAQITLLDEFMVEIDSNIQDLENQTVPTAGIDEEFEGIDEQIDAFESRISGIQASASAFGSEISNLKQKQQDFQSLKHNATQELDSIENIVISNLDSLNGMLDSIDEISSRLENMNISDSQTILYPVSTNIIDIGGKGKNYIIYLFPSLLLLVIMLISILLSSTTVISEKESKAHFRNFLAPVSNPVFIISHFISNSIILIVQTFILVLVAVFAFNVHISNWFSLFLAFLVINSLFILIGLFIGYMFNSEETATLGSISISCIMLFFSSTIIPIETMVKNVGFLAYANPFVLSESILRRIIVFDMPLLASRLEFFVLLFYIFILFICVAMLYNYRKSNIGK